MKFVHAADLHLDSPLCGLPRYDGAPLDAIRGATRRAFENLIDLCLEEGASLLLLAGDVYDGNWKDYNTGLFFRVQLARLREAGIQVVIIRGNHDAESQITRKLRLPEHVRELSWRAPESFELPGLGVVVHGQGFATRAVTEDLTQRYPAPVRGALNIGLLHTSAGGREGHENYAPCNVDALVAKGYDYWALGHVHRREVLRTDPHVIFPGNLQGRHMRETGAKGATLVTTHNQTIASAVHRPLDEVRWSRVKVDVSDASVGDDVLDLARAELESALVGCEGRLLAARIELIGATRAHAALVASTDSWTNEIRNAANDVGDGSILVERVVFGTRSTIDIAKIREQGDALGQLARRLRDLQASDAQLGELLSELTELKQKLPPDLVQTGGTIPLDVDYLRTLVGNVEQMLIPRLLSKESLG
jgi:DNA repair exonuclease SbcCD nuclease subunit